VFFLSAQSGNAVKMVNI